MTKGVIMKNLIASMLLTLSLISIGRAIDPTIAELNNIYLMYSRADYQSAEQKLISLSATNNPKSHFIYSLELGDLYFDKLNNFTRAESIYKLLSEKYPKDPRLPDIYYRLGLTYESEERYLESAQMYEMVATKYRKSKYAQDALDAIERCFKKNYQDLVAKVDGYPITRIEFDDRVSQSPGNYETFDVKKRLLDDMINERLMYQEALNRSLDHTPEFQSRLSEIRNNIMFQNWYDREITKKIKVTEGDKKSYYSKHKSEFIIPEQVSAREILLKTKPEADSIYRLITTYNLPFDSVASETSAAPTKNNGGDLGFFYRGVQPKEIEVVAFKLNPAAISQPFYSETKNGYLILKVEDKKPKVIRTYKEVAAEIENRLRAQKTEETFKSKTDGFKNASSITIDELAIKENRDTIAIIDGEAMTQKTINDYLAKIPPIYRSEFETPEGKKRILDELILIKTWVKQLEKEKFWLFNSIVGSLQETKKNLLLDNIRRIEVSDKIIVSDNDIQKAYQKNIADYKETKKIRTREITVATESLATALRKEAMSGKIPFDSLARQYSTAQTKWMGGDMGYLTPGARAKEIEDVIFKLDNGKISRIFKISDSAYTFMKVEEIVEAHTKKFDDVKTALQRSLRQQQEQELYSNFTGGLQKTRLIERYLVDEIPQEETPKIENPKQELPQQPPQQK